MTARGQTRERLLHTAGDLFRRQGYGATGLSQVIAESGSPKGVLYFHFPDGKEQLAAESVAASGAALGARMAAAIGAADGIAAALAAVGDLFAADLESSGFQDGCPVATVALDAAHESEPIRDACLAVYDSWQAGLARYLIGQGIAPGEAGDLSALVLSSLQGALLLARVRRDVRVLGVTARRLGLLAEAASQPLPLTGKGQKGRARK